jgi:hypothetical protein
MFESGSIFRQFFVPRQLDLDDPVMKKRIRQLESRLRKDYHLTEIPGGWQCVAKKELEPGFVVTPETVLFVMKFLDI